MQEELRRWGIRKDREGGLEIDQAEAEIVKRIYTLRRQRKGYKMIADILNREDAPTKRGGKWYAATVRYILDNPKYKGFIEYYFRWEGESYILRESKYNALFSK